MVRKPRILLTVVLLAAVIVGDSWLMHGRLGHWLAGRTGPVLEPAVAAISSVRLWSATLLSRVDLVTENLQLRNEADSLRAQLAETDALRHELEFTRAAAGIRERLSSDPIKAGIFSWYRAGSAVSATINRGAEDGIAVGDTVITATGSLLGVVRDVYDDHATVTVLGDPTLQIAARIFGTDVSGLVRTGEDGLILDLVQKNEPITEGDLVLTGGNDQFPAGLVIGTVRAVDADQPTLFTIVRLDPAVVPPLDDSVLVLHH